MSLLEYLFQQNQLSRAEAKQLLLDMADGKYAPEQLAAFLAVFRMRPVQQEELQGFREALLERTRAVDLSDFDCIDLCGTGGDGKDSFNISTLAAVVLAGAGYTVAKHGNYGVSSSCGSSDVLQALGYRFEQEPSRLQQQLAQHRLCFLHAPLFHPALKNLAPVRRALGTRSFFNLLGPLVHPAQPKRQLVGVYSLGLMRLYEQVLRPTRQHFAIIHSLDGYDECSLTHACKIYSDAGEQLLPAEAFVASPLQASDLEAPKGGVKASAQLFLDVLRNECTPAQRQVVLANAALAIQQFQPQQNLSDCQAEALESLESGRAFENFKKLVA